MTTKPKAKKFRIRRTPSMSGGAGTPPPAAETTGNALPGAPDAPVSASRLTRPAPQPAARPTAQRHPQPAQSQPAQPSPVQSSQAQAVQARAAQMQAAQAQAQATATAQHAQPTQAQSQAQAQAAQPAQAPAIPADISSARETMAETDIDAIRKEGLTGRQLRMARRVAQKHGLAPISDFDAVRQLRARGIDPFQRSNMLELVVPAEGAGGGAGGNEPPGIPVDNGGSPPDMGGKAQLPQTMQLGKVGLPSTDTMSPADRRAMEIGAIQKDIARRRRRKLALLFTRLAAFVFIPTVLAGWYYFVVATPMYATKTEFMILTADGGSTGGRGLLPSAMYNSQDSIAVQSYLLSKDAMLRLDAEYGFKAHFSDPSIDPIQRLSSDATNEAAHKLYKKSVKIGYDPTEGVVRMEVIAATPKTAFQFSELLVRFAEERVDDLSRQKREDSMRLANRKLEEAKTERRAMQANLIKLQETEGVDPAEQLGVLRQQIATYEAELLDKELQLAALLDNPRPNRAKVDGTQGDVRRLTALLETLKARMTEEKNGQGSLAARAAKIAMAQADLQSADMFLQSALESAKSAETEASKQVRYLTVPVNPIAAESPSYPRAFENTILAFLIFAGIYLMISLTSSILREQVSS